MNTQQQSWADEIVVLERTDVASEEVKLPLVDPRYVRLEQVGAFKPGQPMIFVTAEAISMMREHTASRTDIEVGGLVVGKFAAHCDIAFVLVVAALPALLADGSHGFLRITAEAGVEMDRLRGERYPDLRVVGWYHSHPRFGIFLSGTDLGTHHTAFKNGPFVAFVLDPVNSRDGVFGWENGQVVGPTAYWLLHANA